MAENRKKPKRTPDVEDRKAKVAEWYRQGWLQSDMAEELDVPESRISEYLKEIRAEWKAARVEAAGAAIEVELEKIDRIEREAWAAFDTSRSERTTPGDSRFLEVVLKCVERRCKLLGHDAPKHHKIDGTLQRGPMESRETVQARLEARLDELKKAGVIPAA